MRTFLSEWFGRENGRRAALFVTRDGYEVDFIKDNEITEQRMLWQYSRQYAEDACENWVEEVIK